jgi:hypothetical protein
MTGKPKLVPSDQDLREIFALFSSPTDYERQQVYDETGGHFYGREDLLCEYTLRQEKREFAEGAWRAVMHFLYGNGFVLSKNGKEYDLGTSSGYDVESAG